MTPLLSGDVRPLPFPHLPIARILSPEDADGLLAWLRDEAPWTLRVESFYEQHELSIQQADGPHAASLRSPAFVGVVRENLERAFAVGGGLTLVDISAHRLTPGQAIRIHNDFIGEEETHRLLIQLNEGWSVERGGLLMLFADDRPESVLEVVVPVHASGFAFEISPRSHHAVSSIRDGERFTIVYTFRRTASSSS